MKDVISIRGAREHNLQNINLNIPKNKLVVFTGISGSGKTSLAFDTIYAEGQRRYVESLSSYARQFLGMMEKPDVDSIEGLSPAISIGQKEITHNPRSTVGTVTEIYDYLRLLFARVGHPHCPQCGREIQTQTVQQIVDQIIVLGGGNDKRGKRLMILAPLVKDRKGEYSALFEDLSQRGFSRVRVDGEVRTLDEDFILIRTNRHTIEAVVDRLVINREQLKEGTKNELRKRLTDTVETALKLGNGSLIASEILDSTFEFPHKPKKMEDHLFSEHFACPSCNLSLPEIQPRSFSFNSPHGACPECDGLGRRLEIDPPRLYNPRLSLNEGGLFPWSSIADENTWYHQVVQAVGKKYNFSLDTPIDKLPEKILNLLLWGGKEEVFTILYTNRFRRSHQYDTTLEGVIPNLMRRFRETQSDYVRSEIEKYMIEIPCSACQGTRLRPEALAVTILGKNIAETSQFSIKNLLLWIKELTKDTGQESGKKLSETEKAITKPILKELINRLNFLVNVGLDYLTVNRTAMTLSAGEAQRIRLASQIGSGLSGVLYVLDEPSVGLHARDHSRLLTTLKELRDLGNSVIVVEHDQQTMRNADWIIDFGPGAGGNGGEIVVEGPPEKIMQYQKSLTGAFLSGKRKIGPFEKSDTLWNHSLVLQGASEHNLKNIDVSFPLKRFICITGVSGSGKSTLVMDTLYKTLALKFYNSREVPGKHRTIEGYDQLDKVINIDQSPIGRTPRSNPATYTTAFTPIRELFALTPESRARGYPKGRFSFNVKGGRCENCQGDGQIKIEMQFLPDVYVDCEVCHSKRFNRETLEIEYKGKNIADVLEMTIEEATGFFKNLPAIKRKLETLQQVGLGYVRLGQPAPTLSGGEAQRIKLARELSKKSTGKTLYILDEPTTGLHNYDVEKLLGVLRKLVKEDNTVIVIEHHLDVIKSADWIIDLGPEGGDEGGRIVAEGTVDDIMRNRRSYTGEFLRKTGGFRI